MPSIPAVDSTWLSAPAGAAASSSIRAHADSAIGSARARNRAEVVRGGNVMGNSSKDVEQLDIENQGGIGTDRAAGGAAGTIAEPGGDPEAVLGPHRHQRHALGPAGDDLSEPELGRLVAIIGTVEHGTVQQGP